MKTFLALLRININLNFGISALKYRFLKEQNRIWEPILIGICILIGAVSVISGFTIFTFVAFLAGKAMGRPEMVLTLAFVAGQLVVMFFGIVYIISAFYFANDMNILIPLPLKPSHVLGSKFIVVMLNEYLTLAPLVLPALIIYGAGTGQGPVYWLKALVLLLTAPVIPLTVSALFIIVLMRFVNIRRSKDLFAVLGGLFGLILSVGINFFVQRLPENSETDFLTTISSRIVEIIGSKFPPGLWATYGLSMPGIEGLGYFLLFLGASAALFGLLLWLGNHLFYRSLLSGQEVSRKRRIITGQEMDRRYSEVSSPVMAVFKKEWKLFLRTPIYLINGVAGMIVAPILLLMPMFSRNNEMYSLIEIIRNPGLVLPVSLGMLGVMLFTSCANIVACTSVSREGKSFWISKMIPVAPKQQVTGKLLHSIAVEAVGIVVAGAALTAVFSVPIFRIFILMMLAVLGSALIAILNLMIDVIRPKLEWTNPQEAVKQNMNGLFGMLASMMVIGVLAAVSVLMVFLGFAEWAVYLVLAVIMGGLAVPALIGLFALAEGRYKDLEA